ncbi:alpha-amylase family glycosyl hydrolase [Aureibacter tunicatorum]|uniref:Alpha-amylase n=1 Tax=Aureibacter tunicatorum TaxID=866807 RepID=A0AAE3XP55_9BACT|nr:alpha-amylase family glycosyl hydrolase [Aureibacter tunicatorum]MDR6239475.1 alpha-amylase [Aureibacter tunicatorum]BDD04603.1 hypothetical protein AUTU_20860 [Aureibacter tunicatorum]
MRLPLLIFTGLALAFSSCQSGDKKEEKSVEKKVAETPFVWENANVYFLLTDRFENGDTSNDINFGRDKETGVLRGFEGGDIAGITNKIKEGYFNDLGITAIWMTPLVEQVHGDVDEGTGATYGYHGYWAKDWTNLDPNFGTREELAEMVKVAHGKGIRVLLDVVINHTGPVNPIDPAWEDEWVRLDPSCKHDNYENTVSCALVDNLADIRTENKTEDVKLPAELVKKWTVEGRLAKEVAELDAFFERTGYPRAPRYYIIKWLTDYIRDYGVDGFRVDTAKHTEEDVWTDLFEEAKKAFAEWKKSHPNDIMDDNEFYLVGEVYNYNANNGRIYDFGDQQVDYFDHGFKSLINFGFKYDAQNSYEYLFNKYDSLLEGPLAGKSILNYLTSHDDGQPFDEKREKPFESANKLLLSPGAAQVYYGDETIRNLVIDGTVGDATLRSFMNWDELNNGALRSGIKVEDVLAHYQKLGQFRKNHPSIGAGKHQMINESPYYFTRSWQSGSLEDQVLVGLDLAEGKKVVDVDGIYNNGDKLHDEYSGIITEVKNGQAIFDTPHAYLLISKK